MPSATPESRSVKITDTCTIAKHYLVLSTHLTEMNDPTSALVESDVNLETSEDSNNQGERLPPELFELIIQQVGRARLHQSMRDLGTRTLTSLALVCRSFRQMAHELLFSTIFVPDPHKGTFHYANRLRLLLQLLADDPNSETTGLASHVRHFSIQCYDFPGPIIRFFKNTLPSILGKIFRSGSIEPCSLEIRIMDGSLDWATDCSVEFCDVFYETLRRPVLTRLCLQGFRNIPKDLLFGSSIKHVKFQDLAVEHLSAQDTNLQHSTGSGDASHIHVLLESIYTDHSLAILHLFDMASNSSLPQESIFSELRYFKTYMKVVDPPERLFILEGARSLETLDVEVVPDTGGWSSPIQFLLPSLTFFTTQPLRQT